MVEKTWVFKKPSECDLFGMRKVKKPTSILNYMYLNIIKKKNFNRANNAYVCFI